MIKRMLIGFLLLVTLMLSSQQLFNYEMGLTSYVGGYYYLNNDNKDYEYKSNHNWYLQLDKTFDKNIWVSAKIKYYPEYFDKELYLYSAIVNYKYNSSLEFSWEFDRLGMGISNISFKNMLDDLRADQNFITDYRFNGAVVTYNFSPKHKFDFRLGGNDFNTGIGSIGYRYKIPNFTLNQDFLFVSRDNRFNAKALNMNNKLNWKTDYFHLQNMTHFSLIDYYRKNSDVKSNVFKDFWEARLFLLPYLEPQVSYYYEAENWNKYQIYEINAGINFVGSKIEIFPNFSYLDYRSSLHREHSLILTYKLHPSWDIGLNTKYIDLSKTKDIISYGLQTRFNLPATHSDYSSH